jgi:hypothetical protein
VIVDAYGGRRAAQVFEETWGHLRPTPGRYVGHIIAARSEYDGGERSLIAADFRNVPDSPWLYEAMYELINAAELDEGRVYRFTGVLVVNRSGCRFEGGWKSALAAEQPGGSDR